jgi:gluconolactonase
MKLLHRRTEFISSRFLAVLKLTLALIIADTIVGEAFAQQAARRTIGTIERLDPALNALVPADAKMEIVVDGLDWCEGPLWIPAGGGFVIVSDIPPNIIHRWDPRGGKATYLTPSGYTGTVPRGGEQGVNGSTLDRQKRLILCQHGDRRLARMDAPLDKPEPKYITVADRYEGKRFNSPNDVVCHSSGALYFTDPPYGMEGYNDNLATIPNKELDFQGVYRVATDGKVTLLTKEMERPNGIALSPDEKTLYVANSFTPRPVWMAFPVKDDGTTGEGRVFFNAAELAKTRTGNPDGLEVDTRGNLWATGPGGVLILSPQGKHLGTLQTGEKTSNVAFGEDGSTLYITADMYLLRIRLTTKGLGF